MKVLVLSPVGSSLRKTLEVAGDAFVEHNDFLTERLLTLISPDWVVSYRYRHIIEKPLLDLMPDRFINLHMSLLPYNRGAHPNFWSYAENTPAGVSIHHMDEGIDTGDILFQQKLDLSLDETLASSYAKLSETLVEIFVKSWPVIRGGDARRYRQPAHGTYHKAKDIEPYLHMLTAGWDTPARKIAGVATHKASTIAGAG